MFLSKTTFVSGTGHSSSEGTAERLEIPGRLNLVPKPQRSKVIGQKKTRQKERKKEKKLEGNKGK